MRKGLKIPVVVLDDDLSVSRSLQRFLSIHGFEVQTCETARQCLELLAVNKPSCLLLDINLGTTNGFAVFEEIQKKNLPCSVLFISAYGDIPGAVRAIQEGAVDFLSKPYDPEQVLEAVKRASRKALADWEDGEDTRALRKRSKELTPRQREVAILVSQGFLTKEIADRLGLAVATVKVHRVGAMRCLGARTSPELAQIASRLNLLRSKA